MPEGVGSHVFSGLFGGLLYGLGLSDLSIPVGLLLWGGVFLISLRQIDCRHWMSAAVYVLFCTSSGMLLVVVLPERFTGLSSFSHYMMMSTIFSLVPLYLWDRQRKRQKNQKRLAILRLQEQNHGKKKSP